GRLTGTATADPHPPVIGECPANITRSTDATLCSAVVTYSAPTATDNCGTPTVACAPPSGTAFAKGLTTVTCTATDGAGNTNACSFTVTVNDTQPPAITCPANITRANDTNQCSAVISYTAPSVSDNCPGVETPVCAPPSGSTFQKGVTTVSCNVSDASGNSASCSFTVTVNDTQPPVVAPPSNIVKGNAPNQCSAVLTFTTPSATDNCPDLGTVACSPASGATFPKGTTTVACSVTDASGNPGSSSFTITVNDTQPPAITCPANITKGTDPNQCSAVVTYAAPPVSDNCPGVGAPICAPSSGSSTAKCVTTVSCNVSDASGNSASCSFTVTVNDTQAPVVATPSNIIKGNDPNQCSAVVTFTTPSASDNCPGV